MAEVAPALERELAGWVSSDDALEAAKNALELGGLTAQTSVEQRLESLDTGADDFLGKPFALAEL